MRRRRRLVPLTLVAASSLVLLGACGGDDGGGETVTATDGRVTVEAEDTAFDVDEISAAPGTLEVTLVERGNLDHTFLVEDDEGDLLDGKLTVTNDEEEDVGTFELEAGEYEYFCDIPGHRQQGMEGRLVVE
jgi:plastocyanin